MKEYKETLYTSIRKSTSDLAFYSAGYEECEPGYSYGPRYRSYQLIHFVLKGKGELQDPWCYVWISFLGIDSENYIYQLMTGLDDIYIVHNVDIEKYKELIFKILEFQGKDISRYFYANSLLNQIMAYLFEEIPFEENQRKQNSVADEVKFYLDVNYAEKLVLKDVAKEFGVHPNYMTRIFHEKFRISPKKYLMDLKLKKACHLLTTTSLSIGVIAGSLGFDDQLAFSRIFRKEFGEAPSKYRKKE